MLVLVDVVHFPMALLVGRIWQHCLHSAAIPPYGPELSKKHGKGQCEGFGKQERKTNKPNAIGGEVCIYMMTILQWSSDYDWISAYG